MPTPATRWAVVLVTAAVVVACGEQDSERTVRAMTELSSETMREGVMVDILFDEPGPRFGDLFTICGRTHPDFPPEDPGRFDGVADLGFDQVDDYFGIRAATDEGDDVALWLYPLVGDEMVYHHAGPYTGVRLDYGVLRNPIRRVDHLLKAVRGFASGPSVARVVYVDRGIDLGLPPDLEQLRQDIDTIVAHWKSKGIEVGSDDALLLD